MLQAVIPIKDKLYRYALNILGNEMAAEDVVQEVFIKVWNKKNEIEAIENKEAWCMTVTRNLALDQLRKKKYHHESVESHYSLADESMTPYEATQSEDTMGIIRRAMNELPDDQQKVIHLRDVEGYSYKEIAEVTNLSIEKVKVYLHRGRITLRQKLSNIER
jgi:RNA polymerase sigma-70 factor (ECF subfamily)